MCYYYFLSRHYRGERLEEEYQGVATNKNFKVTPREKQKKKTLNHYKLFKYKKSDHNPHFGDASLFFYGRHHKADVNDALLLFLIQKQFTRHRVQNAFFQIMTAENQSILNG